MKVSAELRKMAERMFDDQLFQTVLHAYRQQEPLGGDGGDPVEIRFDKNQSALSSALDEEQNRLLAEMEALFRENCRRALEPGFTRGLYAAFQEYLLEDPPKHLFESLVDEPLQAEPSGGRFAGFRRRRRRFNEIYDLLWAGLDPERQKLLDSVYCAWENREHGVLVHSFYMGYRWALTVISGVEPVSSAGRITKNLLLLEHDMGFTKTLEELESSRD